jgi:2-C-methyl-D-erythritol 4-phosphate cytidylyltransferase
MIAACVRGAEETGACILGVPAADTLKQADASMCITGTLPRKSVWLAQTPQAFTYDLIRQAHENARQAAIVETDDAALIERMGHPVRIVPGTLTNIKITTPDDLIIAEAIWAARKNLTS